MNNNQTNNLLKQMKRFVFLLTGLLGWAAITQADTKQTVIVDGVNVDKNITKLNFNGDNVTMTFQDGESKTTDLENITVRLSYGVTDRIDNAKTDRENNSAIYNISGRLAGQNTDKLKKGVYLRKGKKLIVK